MMDQPPDLIPAAEAPRHAERRERQLAALYELWRAVPHTAVDRLLQLLAERATACLDAHTCSLLLRERGGDTMTVAASIGLAQDVADSVRLLVGERIAGRVAATAQPVLLNSDPSHHPLLAGQGEDVRARPEVESSLCAPLIAAEGDVLGVLCLSRLRPSERFTESDLRVFSLFAAQAGSVVAQVRVGADRARRQQELAALGRVAEAIRDRLPENVLLEQLAEGVQEVIGFERCQVWQRSANGDEAWTLAAGRGFLSGQATPPRRLPAEWRDLCAPRLLSELAGRQPDLRLFLQTLSIDVETGVIAPIPIRGVCEAIVLADVAPGGSGSFRSEMAETLGLFVGHVSVALENARLFAELTQAGREQAALEREMARTAGLAALGQMAATVAHELRNPLSSIKAAAQFLLDDCADATVCDFLSIVVEEVDGLGRLTTDLLEFARPSPPRPERVDLVALVRASVDFLRAEMTGQNIAICESYAPPAWADVDPEQVGRALRNLLLNAAQAMEGSGGGRLIVSVHPDGPEHFALSVEDTGAGIPPAVHARLFEPFFTTKAKGTGLGLAQVRAVVEAHRGVIAADNAPGGGARFTLRLPAATNDSKDGQTHGG